VLLQRGALVARTRRRTHWRRAQITLTLDRDAGELSFAVNQAPPFVLTGVAAGLRPVVALKAVGDRCASSPLPPVLTGHVSSLPPVQSGHVSSLPPVLTGHVSVASHSSTPRPSRSTRTKVPPPLVLSGHAASPTPY
jgi:hypothetical protein